MKNIFVLILVILPVTLLAQEPAEGVFPIKDGSIYYERIAEVDSLSKEEIYKAVKSWGVNAFRSQKDVLQADDKELGLVAYKYWFEEYFTAPPMMGVKSGSNWKYWCTMKIFIKDNKLKITVTDLEVGGAYPGSSPVSILDFKKQMEPILKKSMAGKNYREKYYENTKDNFRAANKSIEGTINSLVDYIKSGKSEFDF